LVDFKEKVVLDVGAGTGVLSFFALQGGARKVYAVEASNMSAHCSKLVKANNFSDRMTVIAGKIEEIDLPEEVDVIISEPMGYMLFNERMLETYLHAKKWLKPGGKMFPTQGILYVSPFTDEALYLEQMGKSYFWQQRSFHGVDVSVLHAEAVDEYFRQPIVDTFDLRILMSRPIGHMTDFATAHERELHKIDIPLTFKSWTTGYMHGLAFWFDVSFIGAQTTVWLSTAPFQPLTHWYQVRLLLRQPLYVQEEQEITGMVHMVANERQSYDITATVKVVATDVQSTGTYDLKNPNFRYMSAAQVPPGSLHTNPTETFFDSQMVGGGEQQPHTASLQQVPIQQPHPQIIRSSSGQVGHLNQQHSMGELQTGTEVIPVINGSIISPSVHQQTPQGVIPLAQQALTSYSPSPAYGHYSQPRQASVGRQGQHWGGSLQPVQTVSHSAAHQHGMGVGGLVDLGTGTVQHGVGTFQYGMGVAQHAHTNQHVISSPPNENVLYQKWSSQQQPTVLQAVASRS
jgi:SAM-dependent methyltransferase